MTGGRTNGAASGVAGNGSSGDVSGPAPLRMLCVDDNALDLERIERLARRLDPVPDLITASDGIAALEWLADVSGGSDGPDGGGRLPDGVLLDINMPRMDGHETLAAIRADESWKHLFVGMVTTSMRGSDRDRADTLGADAYLVKALTRDGLASTLDEVRRRRASGPHRA